MQRLVTFGLRVLGTLLLGSAAIAAPSAHELTDAVKSGDRAKIEVLIGAHVDVNAVLPDKSRALSWAVDRQDEISVRLLLDAGATPNYSDVNGASPLTEACELGDPNIVRDLMKAGA